jgi:hypothetical protein
MFPVPLFPCSPVPLFPVPLFRRSCSPVPLSIYSYHRKDHKQAPLQTDVTMAWVVPFIESVRVAADPPPPSVTAGIPREIGMLESVEATSRTGVTLSARVAFIATSQCARLVAFHPRVDLRLGPDELQRLSLFTPASSSQLPPLHEQHGGKRRQFSAIRSC